MVSNKKRLYVALYPSGVVNNEERKYHWGFLIGPKHENEDRVPGMRYHVKNSPVTGWEYEERELDNVQSTVNLLARIVIAKVEDEKRLVGILRGTPVRQGDPEWRCRTWLKEALERIKRDGRAVGTSNLDWAEIEPLGRKYVAAKVASGRYSRERLADVRKPKPTWDLLEGKEILP